MLWLKSNDLYISTLLKGHILQPCFFFSDILKCKKDRALPGGQLCPMCSSPSHLRKKELQTPKDLQCVRPVINSPQKTSPTDDPEIEVMTMSDFSEPLGNISLGLSDEHGNQVDLECIIGEPREFTKINWEQVSQQQIASNISLSVDVECPVDREKYEKLWRLIAYYSNVPAHLRRGIMLSKEPRPTYVYRQDAEKDALYYTGVKVNIMAQPAWLMQTSVDLQLNRLQSSANTVNLILSTDFSETVEVELAQRQRRTWVMIESTNTTRKVLSAIVGSPSEMNCNVHSSGHPVIQWMLPDESKVEAPYRSSDNRVSVSSDGQLIIKAVSHTDTGIYYCIAKVHGDLAVLPFHLTVQESSNPSPGEDTSIKTIHGFAGSPTFLPCITSGSADAEINWILPSSNIVSIQANTSRAWVLANGTLHIPQTQLSDSGHYKCIAINQHGVDTLVTKVIVIRPKGPIRPLRKIPARPQSASGVNTQIKVPTEDTEEASGDAEVTQPGAPITNRLDPLRRRITGGVVTGKRDFNSSRNMWRRPPVLRKPAGSQVEDRKNTVDGRRKTNMSKTVIDPEKWADILAKIRDRKAQNTVTALPVQQTTESHETLEGYSDSVTVQEKEGQHYFTTPSSPAQNTQMKSNEDNARHQGRYTTSNSYTAYNSQHTRATAESHAAQTSYSVQHTTPDMNLDLHTTSNSVLLLPQTTSVPPNAVTFWQANTNSARGSSAFSPHDDHSKNTDADGVKTADWWRESESNGKMDSNDRELSSSGSQIIPSVGPTQSERNQNENEKYVTVHSTFENLQTQAMLTTAFPSTTISSSTRRVSDGPTPLHTPQPNSRRKNGGSRRRPSKRKHKPDKLSRFIATAAPIATVRTTALPLKLKPLELTTFSFSTTVPFSSSQVSSSGTMSHEESTVPRHGAEAATMLPNPTSPHETNSSILPLAKPLFESTSAAPSFPAGFPGMGHGKMRSQTTLGLSETTSPAEMFTATTLWKSTGSFSLPDEETQRVSITEDLEPLPHSDSSTKAFHTVSLATDVRPNHLDHQYTPIEKLEKMLLNETGVHISPLPSPSPSVGLLIEHELVTTSGYTSRSVTTTPSAPFEADLDTTHITTEKIRVPEILYHGTSKTKTTTSESEEEWHREETANTGNYVDALVTSSEITHPFATSSGPDAVIPSSAAPYVTLSILPTTGAKMDPSLRTTTQPDSHSEDQQIQNITTSEPQKTPSIHPATQSTDHELLKFVSVNPTSPAIQLTSTQTIKHVPTPTPTNTSIRTDRFGERPLMSIEYESAKHQLPERGSTPRVKPRITTSNFQTFTVNAETDVQLPCEAEGDPETFLSWTTVASGMYDSTSYTSFT